MIVEALTLCALALPSPHFTHPRVVEYHATASDDEKRLIDSLRRRKDIEEVYIHENPQADKLKENGWEPWPYTINGKQIWIRRHPIDDKKRTQESA